MAEGYTSLEQHLSNIPFPKQQTALVPLCGKSRDLITLTHHFNKVVGVEISEKAIKEFLREHHLTATESSFADFKIFQTESITFWCGDFMKLPARKLPEIDLIYDKAALVALPSEKRPGYAEKLNSLCSDSTTIMLHHFMYNQDEMPGPPFSVSDQELNEYFGNKFKSEVLEKNELDLNQFKKFQYRGLKSGLTERFILFTSKI
jgi:thiopurine S-methyltransferase